MGSIHIVFDIGGSKTRVGKIEGRELGRIERFKTPTTPEEGILEIIRVTRTLTGDLEVRGACGGIAGTVEDGHVLRCPHLPFWKEVPLASRLEAEWSAPVTLMNDAELVALGEYFYGAGKGERDMFYITVSTGVGGAHVVDGNIQKGKYNVELGHQNVDGEELENLISGTAVRKRYGISPQDISDEHILNELADILAEGLFNSVTHWFPESIVLGGSMMVGKNSIPIKRVEETFSKLVKKLYPTSPRILLAKLGDVGGLYGGMACLEGF